MKKQKATATLGEIKSTEIRYIEALLAAIRRARNDGNWLDEEVFAEILTVGIRLADVSASDLARDEGISRSAVSKWLNHAASPPVPTRKTVVLWLEQKLNDHTKLLKKELSEIEIPEQEDMLEETA